MITANGKVWRGKGRQRVVMETETKRSSNYAEEQKTKVKEEREERLWP